MKPVSDLLHRTPWLVLLGGGFVAIFALALFVTPFHIIDLRHDDEGDPAQRQAIKREIDNAFADNALDIARGVLRGMRRSKAGATSACPESAAMAGRCSAWMSVTPRLPLPPA